ncbi:MAG: hypothetical protein LBF38_04725 [Deltaproteobacteria bacterium]|jgi:hypothetical protein|nr:hypothetical protein [Deltaproteobacteria bacterium]
MTKSETFLALYCLVAMVAMFSAGLVIRLTILEPSFGDYLIWLIFLILFYLFTNGAFRQRPGPAQSLPDPLSPQNPESPAQPDSAEDSAEPPAQPGRAGSSAESKSLMGEVEPLKANDPFKKKPSELTLLEFFLVTPSFCLKLMLAVIAMDFLGLILPVMSPFPMNNVVRFEAHMSVWGSAAMGMCFSAAYVFDTGGFRSKALVYLLTLLHCLLTFLAHDVLAAKSLPLVLAFCFFFCLKGGWNRFAGFALMFLYFALAEVIERTSLFWFFSDLDWTNPLFGTSLAYDSSLKSVSGQISGLWGMGREYLANLNFVLPELMYYNGLSYLKVMGGDMAVMIYSFLDLSTIMILFWFIFRRLDMVLCFIALPFWGLIFLDQSLTIIAYLNSGLCGLTHGPAFIGSYESGVFILVLATAIMQPGRLDGLASLKKTNFSANVQKPLKLPRPPRPAPPAQKPNGRPDLKSMAQSPAGA